MRRLLLIGGLVLCGCSGQSGGTPLTLDQLPPGHLDTARKTLPGVKFESASKLADGTFEIRGTDARGKHREVEIHPDGKVDVE